MSDSKQYPECEKLLAVKDKSQAIGEFLDWLTGERGLTLAEWNKTYEDKLDPVIVRTENLLAEFFEIDMDKVEKERREILASLQNKEPHRG